MIEVAVLNYLKNVFKDIPVYMEIPRNAPEEFILLEKTGSVRDDRLRTATFAVQSWGGSMYRAMALNDEVVEAMLSITSIKDVSSVQLNSDYNYTDTETKHPRYQAVFNVVHY